MMKELLQRIAFTISVLAAILNPMLEEVKFIRYILLACALIYLLFGWFFPLMKDAVSLLENEIVGFVYSTVFFASFIDSVKMPFALYLVYFGMLLSLGLLIYMVINRKKIRRDMLVQAIILFLISPIPLWI